MLARCFGKTHQHSLRYHLSRCEKTVISWWLMSIFLVINTTHKLLRYATRHTGSTHDDSLILLLKLTRTCECDTLRSELIEHFGNYSLALTPLLVTLFQYVLLFSLEKNVWPQVHAYPTWDPAREAWVKPRCMKHASTYGLPAFSANRFRTWAARGRVRCYRTKGLHHY